jgi:GDP-D-mannose dehydratase
MNLTDEQKQMCIDAGKFGFNTKQLSGLLLMTVQEVKDNLENPLSEIYKHYSKGKALFMLEPFRELERQANMGNVKAAKALIELKNKQEVDQMVNDFLGK